MQSLLPYFHKGNKRVIFIVSPDSQVFLKKISYLWINLGKCRLSESFQIPSDTARKTAQVQGGPTGTRCIDFRAASGNMLSLQSTTLGAM